MSTAGELLSCLKKNTNGSVADRKGERVGNSEGFVLPNEFVGLGATDSKRPNLVTNQTVSFVNRADAYEFANSIGKRIEQLPQLVSFESIQEWEGYVIEINDQFFRARLVDITRGKDIEDEEIDIPKGWIEASEWNTLKEGAILRLAIGYEKDLNGGKRKAKRIVFRRFHARNASNLAKIATVPTNNQ